ncbi:MAG: arginine--tRNA ligase [Nitrospinaceae bacterium]|jgi:arginyl-tRNA synthetase|nr:arginine--tRNA ligase [Nitrospinaceae bacterium]|tara:strand:- start:5394 stop:7058 length:1665 start_codon:yes stop_codon:yes gene_type:complete
MKNIIRKLISDALDKAAKSGELELSILPEILVEKPKDEKFGDFSTSVSMMLAKSERKKPRDIADVLCRHLKNGDSQVSSVDIAGPGFINLKMAPSFFLTRLMKVAELGDKFGSSDAGKGKKVLLEFVSANPTGPLHVGHGRGAAVGDMLGRLLKKAGYDVSTEYYINDVGNQMNTLGRSTWSRYRELLGIKEEFSPDNYQGEYIKDIAQGIIDKHGKEFLDKQVDEVLPFFRKYSLDSILSGIRNDLSEFGVEFDRWFNEKSLYDDQLVDTAVNWLRDKKHIYDKDGAVWLNSSAFKDEKDRVLIKQSGEKTYFCSDIAYHKNKIDRGFEWIVDLWGADHHGYVPRMNAVLEAMGYNKDVFKVMLVQFVALKRGGEKVSMSTRSGEFETLSDVVKEVGVDATRFFFLMRSSDSHLDFDLELAKKESPENPVFYIQYAHARICSIFRKANDEGLSLPSISDIDLSPLADEEEFSLIKKILAFTETVDKSAELLEVHRIAFYLQDLVAAFHGYYSRHRVVSEDVPLSLARLFLMDCLRTTIHNGLSVMGVSAPEKM